MNKNTLVLQNKREELLVRLREYKDERLANRREASREARLKESRKLFTGYFVAFAWDFFELSPRQLEMMNREELTILADIIARKARPWMITQKIFSWLLILPGLALSVGDKNRTIYCSWYYLYHRDILRQASKDYFPLENLLNGHYKAGYSSGDRPLF